jgi:hypothetical protein
MAYRRKKERNLETLMTKNSASFAFYVDSNKRYFGVV